MDHAFFPFTPSLFQLLSLFYCDSEEEIDIIDHEAFDPTPIDPNEPTYCFCGQVSFGEMIACDNDDVRDGTSDLHCPGFSLSTAHSLLFAIFIVWYQMVSFRVYWTENHSQRKVVLFRMFS